MERVIEKWQERIGEVVLGAAKDRGGTRAKGIKIGGETGIYFIKGEDACPNPPVIAMEVFLSNGLRILFFSSIGDLRSY